MINFVFTHWLLDCCFASSFET